MSRRLDRLVQQGFGADVRSALIYERGRPGYASTVAQALAAEFGLNADSRVLDLAAGTGQLARLFVPLVGSVVAVEPSASMRHVLTRLLPAPAAVWACCGTSDSAATRRGRRRSSGSSAS